MVKLELSEQDAKNCLALFTIAAKHPSSSMADTAVAVNMFGVFAKAIDDAGKPSVEPTNDTADATGNTPC